MDLSRLNEFQREAVVNIDGPLLILAGAGSGKTSTLTSRAAYLVESGVAPWRILCITFTNKAAQEMKDRIVQLVGPQSAEMWICTFHSMCVRILRREAEELGYTRDFSIFDTDDSIRLIKQILRENGLDEKRYALKALLAVITEAKNKSLSPGEFMAMVSAHDQFGKVAGKVFEEYQHRMKRNNAMDFDDLLCKTLQLFKSNEAALNRYADRFSHILVDEYQDTNHVQYELVRLLAKQHNLCAVGDDDQSIYGWRGADIQNILDFEKDFPDCKVIRLEQNYRSTQPILDAANAVIKNNRGRKGKNLWTSRKETEPVCVHRAIGDREEATYVVSQILKLRSHYKLSDFAILYRTNAQSRTLEETLTRMSIPYRVYGGMKFYDRREIRDLIAYLRLLINPLDDVSLQRIINTPRRGIGDKTVEQLRLAAEKNNIALFDVVRDAGE